MRRDINASDKGGLEDVLSEDIAKSISGANASHSPMLANRFVEFKLDVLGCSC